MPTRNSRTDRLDESYEEAVQEFSKTVPLIMHGSGDVHPDVTDPATVQLVASMTATYVSNLVEAAIDSHKIMSSSRDAESVMNAPPAPWKRSRVPPLPKSTEFVQAAKRKHKRIRASDEFWDQPLPEPKIKGHPGKVTKSNSEWVGVAGVDLSENRIRSSYVRGTEAISASSFAFPVCHDVYAYGRVKATQESKRRMQPLLVHQPLLQTIQDDYNENRTEKKEESREASDPEDEDTEKLDDGKEDSSDDEDNAPVWPGIEYILPLREDDYLAGVNV